MLPRVADAFNEDIISSVEVAVTNKITDGIIYVDSLLKSVPKEIPIDNVAAINITLVNGPVFSDSSIELEIDGLLTANDKTLISSLHREVKEDSNPCEGLDKMIWISLHEKVLHSAVSVYFQVKSNPLNIYKIITYFDYVIWLDLIYFFSGRYDAVDC